MQSNKPPPLAPRDQQIFLKAAKQFEAIILLRVTNKWSFQYMKRARYQPKPISCKAKTADRQLPNADLYKALNLFRRPGAPGSGMPPKKVDGLVVDPNRWPEAFSPDKIDEALDIWRDLRKECGFGQFNRTRDGWEFVGNDRVSPGNPRSTGKFPFAIDIEPGSLHEGCLTLEGDYLYGDYDLFHIHFLKNMELSRRPAVSEPIGPPNASYAPHERIYDNRDAQWDDFSKYINKRLGHDMIRHGSYVFYKDSEHGVLRKFPEWSWLFAPSGTSGMLLNAENVRSIYRTFRIRVDPPHQYTPK